MDANWGAKLYSQNKCLIQHQSVLFLLFFPSSLCFVHTHKLLNSDINIFLLLILQTQLFSISTYRYIYVSSTLGLPTVLFLSRQKLSIVQISTVQISKSSLITSYDKSLIWVPILYFLLLSYISSRINILLHQVLKQCFVDSCYPCITVLFNKVEY